MIQEKIKVGTSIETREVAFLVQTASKFTSSIKIEINDKTINAKSIMGVIALGALDGKEVTVMAEGNDEEEAIKEVCDFLSK